MNLDVLLCDLAHALLLQHDQGQRALPPFLVWYANDRYLTYPWVLRNDVFDQQRRNPLAAALDHIFYPISDQQIPLGIDRPDIVGVQIAATPEILGIGRVFEVALGEPWGADNYFFWKCIRSPSILGYATSSS